MMRSLSVYQLCLVVLLSATSTVLSQNMSSNMTDDTMVDPLMPTENNATVPDDTMDDDATAILPDDMTQTASPTLTATAPPGITAPPILTDAPVATVAPTDAPINVTEAPIDATTAAPSAEILGNMTDEIIGNETDAVLGDGTDESTSTTDEVTTSAPENANTGSSTECAFASLGNTDGVCAQLLKFSPATCDCTVFCSGKLIACLPFGERTSYSCSGETVAGCTEEQRVASAASAVNQGHFLIVATAGLAMALV